MSAIAYKVFTLDKSGTPLLKTIFVTAEPRILEDDLFASVWDSWPMLVKR